MAAKCRVSKLLVSAGEVAAHLDDPSWRIFDCRHDLKQADYGNTAYHRGHIPGSLFLHLDRDLSGVANGRNGRHPLPDATVFAEKMAQSGVGLETQVVAYDNEGGIFASRLWWLLRWLGHGRVAVLDGGLAGWKRARLPLEKQVVEANRARFEIMPKIGDRVDANFVLAHLDSEEMLLIDARSPERFRGENETLDPVGGHIPGAINRFYVDNLDDDGCFFKSAPELADEFKKLLAGRDPQLVVQQCGSGVTACHNLLAMEIAGLAGSRLYAGSWSEWCADPTRPVVKGI